MSELLPTDVVRHIAMLARLEVTDEQVERFSAQLSSVAGHFADIESLDIADVPPSTHAIPVTNVFRDDVIKPTLDTKEVLDQAPKSQDGRFIVPRILGEEP